MLNHDINHINEPYMSLLNFILWSIIKMTSYYYKLFWFWIC